MSHRSISSANISFNRIAKEKGLTDADLEWQNGDYVREDIKTLFKGFLMGMHSTINHSGCYAIGSVKHGKFRFPPTSIVISDHKEADQRMKDLAGKHKGTTFVLFTKIKSHHVKEILITGETDHDEAKA